MHHVFCALAHKHLQSLFSQTFTVFVTCYFPQGLFCYILPLYALTGRKVGFVTPLLLSLSGSTSP